MLSIILLILKIFGIILLAMLGILLFMIAAILWVPFRYRICGSKYEEIKANVRLTWLLRILYITFGYEGGKPRFILRIFGFALIDSNRPKKSKKKKTPKRKKKKKLESRSAQDQKQTDDSQQPVLVDSEKNKSEKDLNIECVSETKREEVHGDDNIAAKKKQNANPGMKSRIKQILNTIISIPSKLKRFFGKIISVLKAILNLLNKINAMKQMIFDEEAKSTFLIVLKSIKDLLKHASPRRVKGQITFGFDDPCTTGQVLGVVSIVYPFLKLNRLCINPEFNRSVMEGEIDVTGRVYFFTVLHIVIRLLRDKHFKTFRNRIKQFKEE